VTTQTTILAAGTTAASSTDVTVASGEVKKIGIACASAIPADDECTLFEVTPLGVNPIMQLSNSQPSTLVGCGTYRVKRPVTTASIAAYSEV
jgi:hypothetical protein